MDVLVVHLVLALNIFLAAQPNLGDEKEPLKC